MLTRIINYANKILNLHQELSTITEAPKTNDNRHYSTGLIVGCLMTMALCRLGSFNAVEASKGKKIWGQLMGRRAKLCGADTLGRRTANIDVESVRNMLLRCNRQMRRRKTFEPLREGGYAAVVVDGHEINSSYHRDFGDSRCLQREIPQKDGSKRTQYYQRLVTAILVCKEHTQLLDSEMQLPGEGEITTALRLLERVSTNYYHLFDLVLADGLYAQAPLFKAVRKINKHVIAVLKHERRDLTQDVRSLLLMAKPHYFERNHGRIKVAAWDFDELTSWPQTGQTVRVVRTEETRTVVRQARKKKKLKYPKVETITVEWMWVTTLPYDAIGTEDFVNLAHHRWDIENDCFNEMANRWHADHFYKYDFNAIQVIWLMIMLAYNIFHIFYRRNVKRPMCMKELAGLILSEFLQSQGILVGIMPAMLR